MRSRGDLPPALAESRDRVVARNEAEADSLIAIALSQFERDFGNAIARLTSPTGATLQEPGTSRLSAYELQLSLLRTLSSPDHNDQRHHAHPALSPDRRTLYFTYWSPDGFAQVCALDVADLVAAAVPAV